MTTTFEEILQKSTERSRLQNRVDPMSVDCPHCHSEPGKYCWRFYGDPNKPWTMETEPHKKRLEAAQAVGLFMWRIEQATFKQLEAVDGQVPSV